MRLVKIRGRGAVYNPENRFTRLSVALDGDAGDPDGIGPGTHFLRDASRSIIVRNHSPDVGFEYSVNPYRGCEHGCAYCLSGDTPILMADGTRKPLADLRPGDGLYGTVRIGGDRRYVRTRVMAHWRTRKPAYRVVLAGGTELVGSGDHRFLTRRGWRYVIGTGPGRGWRPHLAPDDELVGVGGFAGPPRRSQEYGRGNTWGIDRGGGAIAAPGHATVDRATPRVRELEGRVVEGSAALRVVAVESLDGERLLYDITTGTGDFIANGVVSHNCYARPTHEYLGFSAGLDFETRILVKEDAPELLRAELSSPGWRAQPLAMSGVTDPYQPVERRLRLTRRCLEVLAEFRNPVSIITKGHLVARDADLLGELARRGAAAVSLSLTTLDPELQRVMEPRASAPHRRLDAIEALSAAGVPVGVMVAPVVPGLTDHEIPAILQAAAAAGARFAGFIPLRLPLGVAVLFEQWLELHFPERREKVLGRVREMRGGRLNDARFGSRMRGEGAYADQIRALFHLARRKAGLEREWPRLSTRHFRRPAAGDQLGLFGDDA